MKYLAVIFLLLSGCASKGKVVQIIPPTDPDAHVIGYSSTPIFTGVEVTLGIPALSFVPVIGPYLAEAVRFKAGSSDTLVVPILQEDMYKLHNRGQK